MISEAIPTLIGELVSGRSGQVEWALWPLEVHPTGCLVRLRLVPTGRWREYEDFRTLAATVQLTRGLEHEHILLESGAGEVRHTWGRLPNRDVEPATDEPWEHAWTLQYWWPRPEWGGDTLSLTWPVHDLRLELPIDREEMETAADR